MEEAILGEGGNQLGEVREAEFTGYDGRPWSSQISGHDDWEWSPPLRWKPER